MKPKKKRKILELLGNWFNVTFSLYPNEAAKSELNIWDLGTTRIRANT